MEVEETLLRKCLGDRGLATYYLAKNYGKMWRSLDPLSPDNSLILTTGVLTGYYPGMKMIISGKSPKVTV